MMTEEDFVLNVSNHNYLYDKGDRKYKNLDLKEETWKSIGLSFGMTGEEAKKKFKSLREKYIREKKTDEILSRSGAGKSNKKKWHLLDLMSFLDDSTQPRQTNNNISEAIQESAYGEEYLEEEYMDESQSDTSFMQILSKRAKINPVATTIKDHSSSIVQNESDFESFSSPAIIKNRRRLAASDDKIINPVKRRNMSKLEPVPHIVNTLEKLSASLVDEAPQNPNLKAINSFCKNLADEMCRLPDYEADDLKNSIRELLFAKLKDTAIVRR